MKTDYGNQGILDQIFIRILRFYDDEKENGI